MSLLHEIQQALITEDASLGTALLKLRILASRLGSEELEDWVRHESNGYPEDVEVPDYRILKIGYTGTFVNSHFQMNDVQIPRHLIETIAGEHWVKYQERASIGLVEAMINGQRPNSRLGIEASDLVLLLGDKVYEGANCIKATGTFGAASHHAIREAVRSRMLDLTLSLEKNITGAEKIAIGSGMTPLTSDERAEVTTITNQIIYNNSTVISSTGHGSTVAVSISRGDTSSLMDALLSAGVSHENAKGLIDVAISEKPEKAEETFGEKTKAWLSKKAGKAIDDAVDTGIGIGVGALKGYLKQYYGL